MQNLDDEQLSELQSWATATRREMRSRINRLDYAITRLAAALDGCLEDSEVELLRQRLPPLSVDTVPAALREGVAHRSLDGTLSIEDIDRLASDIAVEKKRRWHLSHDRETEKRRQQKQRAREAERLAMAEFSAIASGG